MIADALASLRQALRPSRTDFADSDYVPSTLAAASPMPAFERLADWLPYSGWLPEERLFLLERPPDARGGTSDPVEAVGFVLAITPQTGADDRMTGVLKSIFNGLPTDTSLQFHLFGSPDIHDFLDRYQDLRSAGGADAHGVYVESARRRVAHLARAAVRPPFPGMPWLARDIRAALSVTLPANGMADRDAIDNARTLRDALATVLKSGYLHAGEWGPDELLDWCAQVLNPNRLLKGEAQRLNYDDGRLLRDQIIALDTLTRMRRDGLVFGSPADSAECVARCFSVRNYPRQAHLAAMGALIGDFLQGSQAYSCPFLITLGIRIPDYESTRSFATLKSARATQAAQSRMAAFMPDWQDNKLDWDTAMAAFSGAGSLVHLYHQLTLFSQPRQAAKDELAARGVWRGLGFDLQEDSFLHLQSLFLGLPMAYTRSLQQEAKRAGRDSLKTSANAIHLAPLIAEWEGLGEPVIALFGRRGQAMGLDLFANPSGNYNACVVGTSGSGKSVFMNELAQGYLGIGAKVWVIDAGHSYENLCKQLGGQYIQFTPDACLSLNPFSLVMDLDEDMEMLKPVIAQMISPNEPLPQYELSQLDIALRQVWYHARGEGRLPTLTELAEHLKTACKDDEGKCDVRVRNLGIQLFPYTQDGAHGRWFEGAANIRFDTDLVVLELDELEAKKDLQSVVLLLLMYLITNEIYLNREDGRRKLVIVDEAWSLMNGTSGGFIESGYRRARKYNGAFVTGTQGVDDYYRNEAATAALNNADWMFMLRQKPESVLALEKNSRLALSEGMRGMLNTLHTEAGAYSEVFVHCPVGHGIGRLVMDPYSLLLVSSKAEDFSAVREKTRAGMNVDEAIRAVLAERGQANG
jgi:conjugal transfer ATP-binding protein TraC